ncbi:MAG: 3-ketoacyl-ACP reductase [Spirochaetota bacterium]
MGIMLITGASRGIGAGIARELARAGHDVAIHYNGNREAASAVAEECRAISGAEAEVFQAQIGVAADRERLVDEVTARFGRIDGLVNNAGIAPRKRDDIVFSEEEIFDEVMQVNLNGPYFLTQLVARRWLEEGSASGGGEAGADPAAAPGGAGGDAGGAGSSERGTAPAAVPSFPRRVVFVTSISAVMVSVNRGEYCVSKAGLAMAAQLFAARLAGEGIGVFEIRPGITKTDMTAGVTGKYDRLIAEGLVPQGRWGFPSDTGAAVRAIMDGALDFSPGSVLYTDGGLHISRL